VALGRYPWNSDTRRFARRRLGLEKEPAARFARKIARVLNERYPAHLHINLSPELQGQGRGALLLDAYFAELRRTGVPGVHLYCGPGPLRFYEANGFRILAQAELRTGVAIYVLINDLVP
jgi:GNAT superfamily N-acetyltransferase